MKFPINQIILANSSHDQREYNLYRAWVSFISGWVKTPQIRKQLLQKDSNTVKEILNTNKTNEIFDTRKMFI